MTTRRNFLRASGCTLALPALESLGAAEAFASGVKPKRLFILTSSFGVHLPFFYPEKIGAGYEFKEVTKSLEPLRDNLTIFGNLRHHTVLNGHHNQTMVLTGSRKAASFKDSLDQFAARHLSLEAPFDCLTMMGQFRGTGKGTSFRNRVPVAQMGNPEEIFEQFFGKKEKEQRLSEIGRQKSVLDYCAEEAKALARRVSKGDQQKLDEYFNSIRETEKFLAKNADFISKPPVNSGYTKEDFHHEYRGGAFPADFDLYFASLRKLAELVFKYDLTRVVNLSLHYVGSGHHGATHHHGRPAGLKAYDKRLFDGFASILTAFKNTQMPEGGTLMDQTVSLYAAGLGDAAGHNGRDLPAIVAGGRFKHGTHVRFKESEDISNIYLTLLQSLGIETESFITGTRTFDF